MAPLFLPLPPLLVPSSSSSLQRPNVTPLSRRRVPLFSMCTPTSHLSLPPSLRVAVDRLSTVPDPKLRYQQLLFLARELPPMSPSLKTPGTRVHGCTSVVHVHVSLDESRRVLLQGDSDAQLTKGLLALLVTGLQGATPAEVQAVDPEFIKTSGLSVSLTPSRNNGFVNMLQKIKSSVKRIDEGGREGGVEEEEGSSSGERVYEKIVRKLNKLNPAQLEVRDDSAKHSGHAGVEGREGETHFGVKVVAEAFEGMSLVQRHRLVYALLKEELEGGVHALQIDAITPEEVLSR